MADPRSARMNALADITNAQTKSKIAVITEALLGAAAANDAALRGRAAVSEADAAAAQAAESAAPEQPDLTEFFGQVPVNPNDPISVMQRLGINMGGRGATVSPGAGERLAQAGPQGARGGAIANRAVVGARQQAGTAPSAAPSAVPPTGGGSVEIGGQTYGAPESIETVRETTGPTEISPGFFYPTTTRETLTAPNVLTPGDLLQAAQRQEEFRQTQSQRAAEFVLSHSLQTNQAKAAMAFDLMRTVDAPAGVLSQAADLYMSGETERATQLLGPYDTAGAADITAKRAMAAQYRALARKAEVEMGLNVGSLYDAGTHHGIPPGTKPLTADQVIGVQESIADDLKGVMGAPTVWGMSRGPSATPQERAGRLANIGKRAVSIGQALVFPTVDGKPAPKTIPYGQAMVLLHFADGGYNDPAVVEQAQRTIAQLNIGYNDEAAGRIVSQGVPQELRPWVDELHNAWRGHTDEEMRFLLKNNADAVERLMEQYAPSKPKPRK